MKQEFSSPVLAGILLLFSGIIFPLIFTLIDKLLRSVLITLEPTVLTIFSFSWLLLLYYYGIKVSLTYITDAFIINNKMRLFIYSNVGYTFISGVFYYSLISSFLLSNLLWGLFYLATIVFFYILSTKALLAP